MTLLTTLYPWDSSAPIDNGGGLPIATNYAISCEENECPPSCEDAFDMVHVSYLIRGGTRVMWQFNSGI